MNRYILFINLVKIKQSKLEISAYTYDLPDALSDWPRFNKFHFYIFAVHLCKEAFNIKRLF